MADRGGKCQTGLVQPMATRAVTPTAVPKTYAELRAAVIETIVKGQQAYEIARVRTYHETGRLVHEHVLLFKQRADHGARTLISQLAASGGEIFLNNALLQHGHAVRYDGGPKDE